jgi:hypothetical protein
MVGTDFRASQRGAFALFITHAFVLKEVKLDILNEV